MSDLPEPAATIHRLTEKLREDLAFAAPEVWALHIEKRLAQAYEAGEDDADASWLNRGSAAPQPEPSAGLDAERWKRRAEYAEAIVARVCTCSKGTAGNRETTDPACPVHLEEAALAAEYARLTAEEEAT